MTINPVALTIRAKKLGVLIRDARLTVGKTIEECAGSLGVTPETFEAFEIGNKSPSLPELEALAYDLNISLDHFWEDKIISDSDHPQEKVDLKQAMALRQRIVGALLRKARLDAGLSLEALAERAASSPTLLETYELGEAPIPLPDLELLSGVLGHSIREFQDRKGIVGAWVTQQRAIKDFMTLPLELQDFVSKPINRPYLELALRLSGMSVDRLRAVAEGLLEITL